MRTMLLVSSAAVAALVAGVALVGYSPSACSCVTPIDTLTHSAGLDLPGVAVPAATIEAGLNRTLRGRSADPTSTDFLYYRCQPPLADRLVCRVPIEESPLLTRGLVVTYHTVQGRISHVSVRRSVWL
jgi:hypothetical protein